MFRADCDKRTVGWMIDGQDVSRAVWKARVLIYLMQTERRLVVIFLDEKKNTLYFVK